MLKFSIITPSFNQGRFIRDTIESVINQNYWNFEHIVIDGGSTDETIDIIREYPHLKWISEKDSGPADAINKGFMMANGDVITWINSDDYYEKNIFSTINDFFTKDVNIEFLYGNRTVYMPTKNKYFTEKTPVQDAQKLIHSSAEIVRQPCSFYRYSLLKKVGMLNVHLKIVFDYELFIRMFLMTKPYYVDQSFAVQRDYEDTLTRRNLKRQAIEIYRVSRKYGSKITDPIIFHSVIKKILFPNKF